MAVGGGELDRPGHEPGRALLKLDRDLAAVFGRRLGHRRARHQLDPPSRPWRPGLSLSAGRAGRARRARRALREQTARARQRHARRTGRVAARDLQARAARSLLLRREADPDRAAHVGGDLTETPVRSDEVVLGIGAGKGGAGHDQLAGACIGDRDRLRGADRSQGLRRETKARRAYLCRRGHITDRDRRSGRGGGEHASGRAETRPASATSAVAGSGAAATAATASTKVTGAAPAPARAAAGPTRAGRARGAVDPTRAARSAGAASAAAPAVAAVADVAQVSRGAIRPGITRDGRTRAGGAAAAAAGGRAGAPTTARHDKPRILRRAHRGTADIRDRAGPHIRFASPGAGVAGPKRTAAEPHLDEQRRTGEDGQVGADLSSRSARPAQAATSAAAGRDDMDAANPQGNGESAFSSHRAVGTGHGGSNLRAVRRQRRVRLRHSEHRQHDGRQEADRDKNPARSKHLPFPFACSGLPYRGRCAYTRWGSAASTTNLVTTIAAARDPRRDRLRDTRSAKECFDRERERDHLLRRDSER